MEIGLVGIGNMGLPMAGRLLDAGHRLVVHDVHSQAVEPLVQRNAIVAGSAKEVADQSEIVLVSLPDNDVIRQVVTGEAGLLAGERMRLYINTCTTGSPFACEMTALLAERGVAVLEAPISGGPPGAEAGTLSIMVSGPRAAFDRLASLFDVLGKTVTYCGDRPGLAQVAKLANNIFSATALIASLEALAMGAEAGLDVAVLLSAINGGSGRNSATEDKIPRDVITGTFAYGAPMRILMKDIDLALAEGEAQGVPQLVCQQVRQLFRLGMNQGWAERDITEMAKLIEGWSRCEIRARS